MQQVSAKLPHPASNVLRKPLRLPSQIHASAIANATLLPDPSQAATLPLLDSLVHQLPDYDLCMRSHADSLVSLEQSRRDAVGRELKRQQSSSIFHKLSRAAAGFSNSLPPDALPNAYYGLPEAPSAPLPPRGLYLHGDVGCGKSLLMDMLFASARDLVQSSARVHFHAFMMSVYQMIHQYDRMSDGERAARALFHPLDAVVGRLGRANASGSGGGLLCFDEFQVADVGDARLMHGIFDRLMRSGTVVCFTANRAPADVNRSQLQDKDFVPFLDLMHERCELVELGHGVDYRERLADSEVDGNAEDGWSTSYFARDDEHGLREAWGVATGTHWDDVAPVSLKVAYGRNLHVERARADGSAVQMSCAQLIEAAVGASDYRALVKFARCIFVSDVVPIFDNDTRNFARRFITLIDVCYEEKVRLVMRMAADDLDVMFSQVDVTAFAAEMAEGLQFEGEVGKQGVGSDNRELSASTLYTGEDEAFAFRRAISRLKEMQTASFGKRNNLF